MKANTGADANLFLMTCTRKLRINHFRRFRQPLKAWLATEPIHPLGYVRLKSQYKSRTINILYLVVREEFTPLLGCYAYLDLEVLKCMNLDLIRHTDTERKSQKTQPGSVDVLKTDPVLREYQDCVSEKPGKLPNHVSLELDKSVSPVIHPPRTTPIALLEPAKEKLLEMERSGLIVKEEGHTSWGPRC